MAEQVETLPEPGTKDWGAGSRGAGRAIISAYLGLRLGLGLGLAGVGLGEGLAGWGDSLQQQGQQEDVATTAAKTARTHTTHPPATCADGSGSDGSGAQ